LDVMQRCVSPLAGIWVLACLLADLAFTTTSRAFVLDVHRRSTGFCCYWTFEGENSSTWTVRAAVVHQHAFELDAVC
jgi:hypothetical protein